MFKQWLQNWKSSPFLCGFVGTAAVGVVVIPLFILLPGFVEGYALGTFCFLPFVLGFLSAAMLTPVGAFKYRPFAASALWSLVIVAVALVALRFEGLVCIGMAAPLEIPIALLGAGSAYGIRRFLRSRNSPIACVAVLAVLPISYVRDSMPHRGFVRHVETTTIIVNAPPEIVWPFVCSLRHLPYPDQALLRLGVAYPDDIELIEPFVGGRRHCHLSTGDMPEVVAVIEPNRRLVFRVLSTPPTMRESSPYGEFPAAHLTGYYQCQQGEFRLEPLAGGRTRVVGTSWYFNRLAPDLYWSLWTNSVVEEVHLDVMREIKRRSEQLVPK